MARITCSKSGVIFNCEHMPIALSSPSYVHPFFHIPQKKLISLAGVWASGKLTDTESYLLFLSLLDSTSLIQWRHHVIYRGEQTDAIVANNMESLLHIIAKINLISHPSFTLPSFAIGADTADIANAHHWIKVWKDNYTEWYESHITARNREELKHKIDSREDALQRLIRSATPPENYANMLADWAALAGNFPSFTLAHPISKSPITLSDYWKQIIRTIAKEDALWRLPRKDIVELIEHCEDNIQHGNIYAHALMKYLRTGLARYDDYLGFGETPTPTVFTVMPANASVHAINKAALLSTAPIEEPKKSQYTSHFAWLKAYSKWKLSQIEGSK